MPTYIATDEDDIFSPNYSRFSFSISTYRGFESEVLNLRNRNRQETQIRKYMDWRYLGLKTRKEPLIFWVQNKKGTRIGMAAFIFRPYWVNDELREAGVLGDISLDMGYRGSGVARAWFAFVNSYLKKENIWGLVIPNLVAGKLLAATGWYIREKIVHHVYLLDPNLKLISVVKNLKLAQFLGLLFTSVRVANLARQDTSEFDIEEVRTVDQSFEALWNKFSKKNMVVLDKGSAYLNWRYKIRPNSNYAIAKFIHKNKTVGYVVYSILASHENATIYEIFAEEGQEIKKMMIQFVRIMYKINNLCSIRCPLNEKHPYSSQLTQVGFSKRKGENKYLTFNDDLNSSGDQHQWIITGGDKDT